MKQINQFVIRKTNPKKGLPNGAWVCFNKSINKYQQNFGKTPKEVLDNYLKSLTLEETK